MRDETAHGGVVGVNVRFEEFGEQAWFLVWWWGGKTLLGLCAVGAIEAGFIEGVAACAGGHATFFDLQQGFLFCFEGAGEVVEEWVEC
jgi:hypothetical protein